MKTSTCSICASTALAVSISACALIALFWGVILLVVLAGNGPALVTAGNKAHVLFYGLKITDITGTITALCALVVAVGSLAISLRHHRLSVRPKLSIVRVVDNKEGRKKGLYLRNHGLGPAIITSIKFESKSMDLVMQSRAELSNIPLHYALATGDLGNYWLDMLPKDQCERLLWLEEDFPATEGEFRRLMSDIRLTVTYESFYKQQDVEIYG